MKLENEGFKRQLLKKVSYHWHSYVARGGYSQPTSILGKLENGGLKHWMLFLKYGRQYILAYPKEEHVLEAFVPKAMMKMLTGA